MLIKCEITTNYDQAKFPVKGSELLAIPVD